MIVELGHLALCVAFVVAVLQSVVPLVGVRNDSVGAMQLASRAAEIQFVALAVSFAALTHAYVVSDFSVVNVALNSHSSKPLI